MTDKFHDWSKFSKRVSIKAGIQNVYDAWTKQANLEQWFLRSAEFTKPDNSARDKDAHTQKGDTYKWMWYGYGDDVVERGTVLEANGKDFLQFTFTGGCIVSVHIKVEQGVTIAELWQEQIPTDDSAKVQLHISCSIGWTFFLTNLKSILEGGIDLRNKNEKLVNVINS